MVRYQAIRGMRDILPSESPGWRRIEDISREMFGIFGYREIQTPIMEETGLFKKTIGEDTDIVKKEMFSFTDRGERDISLRPEGTAPVIRAYLEHSLDKTEPFQKFYYIGPMFRAERPQAGRLRQFYQIGVEAIGTESPFLDAEVINMVTKLLVAFGMKKYELRLNNLGCRDDKKKLSGLLKEMFSDKQTAAALCEDCRRRLKSNPLRIIDCKNETCRTIIRKGYKDADFLCGDCKNHFSRTTSLLDLLSVKYIVDPYIVRGLDYYTRTVFEITHSELGAQNALGAGGRYDNLISDMGGPRTGACGFALGIDRILMALHNAVECSTVSHGTAVYIATIGETANEKGFILLNGLREEKLSCDIGYENGSLKSQMRKADRCGARFVVIIGDEEIAQGAATLRDMKTKEQTSVKFGDVVLTLKKKLG